MTSAETALAASPTSAGATGSSSPTFERASAADLEYLDWRVRMNHVRPFTIHS
jgi:hypothetical protein